MASVDVHAVAKKLSKCGVVRPRKFGRSTRYRLVREHELYEIMNLFWRIVGALPQDLRVLVLTLFSRKPYIRILKTLGSSRKSLSVHQLVMESKMGEKEVRLAIKALLTTGVLKLTSIPILRRARGTKSVRIMAAGFRLNPEHPLCQEPWRYALRGLFAPDEYRHALQARKLWMQLRHTANS